MESVIPPLSTDAAFDGRKPLTVPALINGQSEILSTTFDVVSPYTGSVAWRCSSASESDALRAVAAAEAAFPAWSATKPVERRRILMKAADLMAEREEEISAAMRTEMGASVGASSGFIVPGGIQRLREIAALATTVRDRTSVPDTEVDGQSAMVLRVPVGVVLGIVPWNAPVVFANRSIGHALAAGCTTVIKASEFTPRTYQLVSQCYYDAGVPAGALNLIYCQPSDAVGVVNAMIEHPAVRKINFTGSTATGRKIAIACARQLKPCLMELGGKNSALVLEDADLELAATQCILGAFLNSGQICMSTDRILVHEAVADQFRQVFVKVMAAMFPPENPPPTLYTHASKERVEKVVAEAIRQGAKVVTGEWEGTNGHTNGHVNGHTNGHKNGHTNGNSNGTSTTNANSTSNGIFLRPVVLDKIPANSSAVEEEFFGSVVALCTFSSNTSSQSSDPDAEAIRLANDTGYGLSASVFTSDLRRGFRVARRLEAGSVHVNSMTVQDNSDLPFGGVKNSGWGRFNGRDGFDEFLVSKTVTWMD